MSYETWDTLGAIVKFVAFALLLASVIISLYTTQHRKPGTYWEDYFLTFRRIKLYTPKGQRLFKLANRVGLAGFVLLACWMIFFLQSWE